MIKEMGFDFHISNMSITLFGFKPKNQIKEKGKRKKEKGKTRKSEYQFNENRKI
ncbi:hypothetical protein OO184_11940 [Photorhabdus sp. APURE]|uniref:hypothetical protein n=1 Tax=Photorhabdus aballayi TaxID=2991723 RepID=UPI00223CC8F0|nr:hypothetical protein [Photorhabdus aballayi]MCW7548630.1 hypothetical protein [Photorhabdus aballayi]